MIASGEPKIPANAPVLAPTPPALLPDFPVLPLSPPVPGLPETSTPF